MTTRQDDRQALETVGPAPAEQASLVVNPLAARQSLRERVSDALRAAIVSGEMRPGLLYSAPTLAAQFEVSATPVREAMLDLVKEGLVEPVRNRGFRVREISEHQLDEITELRALIEVPTIARLAAVIRPDQVDQLADLSRDICAAAADGDLVAYIEADRRFHLAALSLAGNQRLVEVVCQLRSQTRLYGLSRLVAERRLTASAEEHVGLVDALRRHDVEACEQLMRRHLGHVRGLWGPSGRDQ